jgi:mannose-6-phosphate isomerase-like protein (cupin superfamily)
MERFTRRPDVFELSRYNPSMPTKTITTRYHVAQLEEVAAVPCPCGFSRRAFAGEAGAVASMHLVDITTDAKVHYHKRLTEIYLILEGDGYMELDGHRVPVRPMTAVYIRPGCRHRAVGRMKIVNVPVPAFDEADEWFDE